LYKEDEGSAEYLNETATLDTSVLPGFRKEIKFKVNRATFEREAEKLAEVFGEKI
jgi:glucuronate isomerase